MEQYEECAACGARNPVDASWCGQCLQALGKPTPPGGRMPGAVVASAAAPAAPATPAAPQSAATAQPGAWGQVAQPGVPAAVTQPGIPGLPGQPSPSGSAAPVGTGWVCVQCQQHNPFAADVCAACGLSLSGSLRAGTATRAGSAHPRAQPRRSRLGFLDRIRVGFHLVAVGFRSVGRDPVLLVVPAIELVVFLAILGVVWGASGLTPAHLVESGALSGPVIAALVVLTLAGYLLSVLTQATVVCAVTERFDGRQPQLGRAFERALGRIGALLGWAVISAIVGTILEALRSEARKRGGLLGGMGANAANVAWHAVTALVVPVVVFEREGPFRAMGRSKNLFRQVWGQTLVGGFGVGLAMSLLAIVGVLVALPFFMLSPALGVSLIVLFAIVLALLNPVVSGAFTAALYRYATTGQIPGEYQASDLQVPAPPLQSLD